MDSSVFGSSVSEKNADVVTAKTLMDWQGTVSWTQMANSVAVFGSEYVSNQDASAECLLRGDMQVRVLEEGLLVYRTQVEDQCDIRTSNVLNPSLKLLLLLDGCMDVRYGKQWWHLDATQGARGLVVNLAQSDVFMRQWQHGRKERKLLISCTPQWLQRKGLLERLPFLQQHLAALRWQPSRKAIALAEQLHHGAAHMVDADALQLLLWQAKAQALLCEALHGVEQKMAQTESASSAAEIAPRGLSVQAYKTLVALREWMATPASDGMDLAAIAQHAGMSVSYLRRHFAAVAHGQSVAAFLRTQRLQRACQALEQEGICVVRAAEIAGYASVTHFAKAFRQAYGCAPSQWRSGA